MSQSVQQEAIERKYLSLVFLVSIGFFMQGLDTTIVNTALPAMATHLNVDPLNMHGVVVAYVLAVAAAIPLSGWLSDRFGLRNTYLAAIVIFTIGSLGCGFAQNYEQLIVFRIIQGLGGAFLLPVGRLAMLKLIPRSQFLSAMSWMSLAGLIGPLCGPVLGGWLVEITTWHWIFLINLPIGILGAWLTYLVLPQAKEIDVPRFDISGFILLLVAMVSLSLGVEQLSYSTTYLPYAFAMMAVGVITAVLYAIHAHFSPQALFRAELFRHRVFALGILGNFFARFGGNAMPFVLPLMLQVAFGYGALETGLMMIPLTLGSLASKPIIRRLVVALGYRHFLMLNTLLVGGCIASFALLTADTPLWLRTLHFFIFGILNSLQFVGMNTLTLKDLPTQHASSGNGFLSMVMMLSMSIGVALASTLINQFSHYFGAGQTTAAFHAALVCLGCINIITFVIFWCLPASTEKIR